MESTRLIINDNYEESRIINNDDEKNNERLLSNGNINNKILPEISSSLMLDSFFDEKSDLSQIFGKTELKKVIDLSMQANCLYELPDNIGKNLSNLTKINLSYNNLKEIDESLKCLKNLEKLIIDKNRLIELPNYLNDLFNLRLISAKGNKLVNIPKSVESLANIEEIDLSDNMIRDIDHSWEKLDKLKIINLSHNELKSPPKCITQGSPRLEILDLSHNHISQFSCPPLTRDLQKFHFNHNPQNKEFPRWLLTEKFSKLEELILDETAFDSYNFADRDSSSLINVRKLSMIQCRLTDTDFEQMSQSMIQLEYLNVGNDTANHKNVNSFWLMPARNLNHPKKLEELDIKACGLAALPREINTLENLTRLDISRNNISSLPEEICELKKLEFLNAGHNSLYALPQDIGNLKSLKILFLETNKLSSLPDSIIDLEHLEYLDLYNNEFLQVPSQLNNIRNLKALDIDANVFETDNLQIANIKYLKAKDILRSTSNLLLLRSDDPKVLDEADNDSLNNLLDYEEEHCSSGNKSLLDLNLSDITSDENWDVSDDSADEYDPTAKPRTHLVYSPFTASSVPYRGKFCPADLHSTKIMDQLAAMQAGQQTIPNIEEGQFDDA